MQTEPLPVPINESVNQSTILHHSWHPPLLIVVKNVCNSLQHILILKFFFISFFFISCGWMKVLWTLLEKRKKKRKKREKKKIGSWMFHFSFFWRPNKKFSSASKLFHSEIFFTRRFTSIIFSLSSVLSFFSMKKRNNEAI